MVDRTIKSQTVTLTPNQILTKELSPDMKQWEELIRENMFGLGGHRDHLPAYLAHMLYCVVAEEQYNLAYFFVKRIECARANPTTNLPYGMFLTCLYRYIMEAYPHLDNGIYDIVDRVMRPLALKQTRRPRSLIVSQKASFNRASNTTNAFANRIRNQMQRHGIRSISREAVDDGLVVTESRVGQNRTSRDTSLQFTGIYPHKLEGPLEFILHGPTSSLNPDLALELGLEAMQEDRLDQTWKITCVSCWTKPWSTWMMNYSRQPTKVHVNLKLITDERRHLIADEDAMDKEVTVKVKDHKRKHDSDDDEDDDDDEGPSAGSNQGRSAKRRRPESAASGSAQPPPKDDDQSSKKPRKDSFIVSKKRSSDSSKKLKGSNEGTGNILGVPDESTVISRASSEGTGSKPGVPDEEKLIL
ncbi:hypothetical protein Tco_0417272 [Tanacetum coccineum]